MKVTYDTTGEGDNLKQATNLLIECGCYDMTMLWYRDESVLGVKSFQYKYSDADEFAEIVDNVLYNTEMDKLSVKLVMNTRKTMLIPEVQNIETHKSMMELFHGKEDVQVFTNAVHNKPYMHVLFSVENSVKRVFEKYFNNVNYLHANSFQASAFEEGLTCILYHRQFKIVFVKDGELELIQYFNYETPSDVAYQLLNIASIYNLNRDTFPLYLSGMIEADSNLYREMEKYFLNMQTISPVMSMPVQMDESEQHYFSHLLTYIKN